MKPAAFAYHPAHDLDEAIFLLTELGDGVKVLAGGQSLIPLMNMRLAKPEVLIDIGRIPGLDRIEEDGDSLVLGALVRHRMLEQSPLVRANCGVLSAAAGLIGHFQIRERGTLGGSLAHADPSAELPLVATLLDAELTIQGPSGERTARAAEFFQSYFMTSLEPAELIARVRFRKLRPGEGWSVREVARREGDFAIVAAAATVALKAGRFTEARIALGGVGATPVLADVPAAMLLGEPPSDLLMRSVADRVAAGIDPDADLHASAEDRRDLTRALLFAVLQEAVRRARW